MRFDDRRLEIEELIGAVAKRHNALLTADDPIFMTVTLHELLLDRALTKLAAMLAASEDQIAASTAQHLAASKALGERLVTAGTEHMIAQIHDVAKDATEAVKTTVAAELQAIRNINTETSALRQSAWWAVVISAAAAAIAVTIAAVSPLLYGHAPLPACRTTSQLSASSGQPFRLP